MEKRYQVIKPKHGFYKGECLDTDIAPTIDTGVGCWHTLIGESMEEIKCEQVSILSGGKWDKRTADSPTEQRLEIGSEETSNTLTTVQKDNLVVEPTFIERAIRESGGETMSFDPSQSKKFGYRKPLSVARALRAENNSASCVIENYQIRKLTEQECFRLMGVKKEDFERVAKNQSTSSLYHLAGDSIVTTCLMAIFGELFEIDYETKINNLIGELKQ